MLTASGDGGRPRQTYAGKDLLRAIPVIGLQGVHCCVLGGIRRWWITKWLGDRPDDEFEVNARSIRQPRRPQPRSPDTRSAMLDCLLNTLSTTVRAVYSVP